MDIMSCHEHYVHDNFLHIICMASVATIIDTKQESYHICNICMESYID